MPERVIVTCCRPGDTLAPDLELPADMPAAQLAAVVARALGWDAGPAGAPLGYRIEAAPPGRTLGPDETLAAASVWDGACLVFHPVPVAPLPPPPAPRPPAAATAGPGHPVRGWRPLLPEGGGRR